MISHMHMDHVLDLLPFSGEITQPGESGAAVLDGLAGALGYDGSRFRESFHLREYGEGDAESLRQARERFGGPVELAEQGAVYPTPA